MSSARKGLELSRFLYGGLDIHRVNVKIRLLADAALPPFKGSTFRGLLGQSLLAVCCPHRAESCSRCRRAEQCPYSNFSKPHLARQNRVYHLRAWLNPCPTAEPDPSLVRPSGSP